jgi:hypothetical protein
MAKVPSLPILIFSTNSDGVKFPIDEFAERKIPLKSRKSNLAPTPNSYNHTSPYGGVAQVVRATDS